MRLVVGVVLGVLAYQALSGVLAVVAYIIAAVALVTGLVRYCPANALPGIDTCGRESA